MALMLIKPSRKRGRETFVQTVISTNAIKADSKGMMLNNHCLSRGFDNCETHGIIPIFYIRSDNKINGIIVLFLSFNSFPTDMPFKPGISISRKTISLKPASESKTSPLL